MAKKLISVICPCYNEEANVGLIYEAVKSEFAKLPEYEYEHIFIDNASQDKTRELLKKIAVKDKNVKLIFNARNFGQIRSPYHGLLQGGGEATILIASDMQDPPSMIPKFIKHWAEGFKIVIGIKEKSEENRAMFAIRKVFYRLIKSMSQTDLISNFTGFGIYDKKFIEVLKNLDDPYPYFRGLVAELGFKRKEISYTQAKRKRGKSSNNFFSLYEMAMVGFVNHTKLPLRLASFIGFSVAFLSLLTAVGYLIYKLIYWQEFQLGTAPLIIGLFFFSSIQLFFIGIIGEYIGAIYTQVKKHPLVIESERINF